MDERSDDFLNSLPLVTVAIPTHNRADRYLPQTLQSALNQTYPNIEIIISDNCSTDNTKSFVHSVSDPRIRYFRQSTNIGSNNNLNFCLSKAKGKFFCLLCDDDLIDKDFIEDCIKVSRSNSNVGIIITGTRLIDANGKILNEKPNIGGGFSTEAFFMAWLVGKVPLYLCSTLFHTEKLRQIGGFKSPHNLYDDVVAQVQLAAKYTRVDVRDIKASPRYHELKLGLSSKITEWCEDSVFLLNLMCELATENKTLVRHQGMITFAKRNYSRASTIKSPIKRLIAYLIVFKKYNFQYFPPIFAQRLRGMRLKTKAVSTRLSERSRSRPRQR